MSTAMSSAAVRRAANWKLRKVDWDQCPDPLFGQDKWSPPTVTPGILHPAGRLSRILEKGQCASSE